MPTDNSSVGSSSSNARSAVARAAFRARTRSTDLKGARVVSGSQDSRLVGVSRVNKLRGSHLRSPYPMENQRYFPTLGSANVHAKMSCRLPQQLPVGLAAMMPLTLYAVGQYRFFASVSHSAWDLPTISPQFH
jgi:hypothetical protein